MAKSENEIFGFLISFISKGVPYISVVAVKQEEQHKGIATNLIKHCLDYWTRNDYEGITIHVDHHRKPAIKLYKKIGFEIIEEREEDLYMKISITPHHSG